jgi:phosphoheptose isomerase
MELNFNKTDDLHATLTVALGKEDYNDAVEKQLKKSQKQMSIKGFRPGHAPMGMIKSMYGKSILAEEINKIASQKLFDYLKENYIDILAKPLPSASVKSDVDIENKQDFTFAFDLGLAPRFEFNISDKDVLVGIAASGTTPYVIGGLKTANENGLETGCIVCNAGSPVAEASKYPIEVVVGPEFVTGSTRMKSGTAQKLVLNMISTTTMIRLGKVKGNKMVDMQLSNIKLVGRAVNMIMQATNLDEKTAQTLLDQYGSVRKAVENAPKN